MSPLSMDSRVLSVTAVQRNSSGIVPTLLLLSITAVSLTGISLAGRNISPKL